MANPFVHVELNTNDVGKAKEFYGKLFGWHLEDVPMPVGTYTTIGVGDGTGGGMLKMDMPGGAAWIPYVLVDDVRRSTETATSAGGTVLRDITEIPKMGSFSIVQDPTGGVIGLWEAAAGDGSGGA